MTTVPSAELVGEPVEQVVGHVALDDVARRLGVGDRVGERGDEVVGVDVAIAGERDRVTGGAGGEAAGAPG